MRIPTVKIRHRATGKTMIVNETDYALGSLPGVDIGSWERVGESQGTDNGAVISIEARRFAQALHDREARGEAPKPRARSSDAFAKG